MAAAVAALPAPALGGDRARLLAGEGAEEEEEGQAMLAVSVGNGPVGPRGRAVITVVALGIALSGVAVLLGFLGKTGTRYPHTNDAADGMVSLWQGGQECSWLANDNCVNSDATACKCRQLNPNGPCSPCPSSHKQTSTPKVKIGSQSGAADDGAMRKGSILVIGDWGYDFACHGNVPRVGCQQAIADKMLEKMEELGDVKFIINVGDSFYPHGVMSKSDPQWESKWRRIFAKKLRDVPWYSVYGNHDLQHDPCACSEDLAHCAQINSNLTDLKYFYMPDLSWFKEHPDLGLEVVALEMNHFMLGWDHSRNIDQHHFEDCQYTSCEAQCLKNAKVRADEAFKLFYKRAKESTAKNLIVFSHYPTDYFSSAPQFLAELRDASKHHVLYLGGHRHNVDQSSTTSINPNNNWLVGGGGGWSCDGDSQGFLVVEIGSDSELTTYPVTVDKSICCQPPGPSPWKGEGCAWLGCDNCIDPKMCECRGLNPDGPCTQCPNSKPKGRICSGSSCSDGHF